AIIQTESYVGSTRPHFSVLLSASGKGAYLLDAPHKPLFYSSTQLKRIWTGNALVFFRSPEHAETYRHCLDMAYCEQIIIRIVMALSGAIGFFAVVAILRQLRVWHLLTVALSRISRRLRKRYRPVGLA